MRPRHLIVAVAAVSMLAGCGSDNQPAADAPAEPPAKTVDGCVTPEGVEIAHLRAATGGDLVDGTATKVVDGDWSYLAGRVRDGVVLVRFSREHTDYLAGSEAVNGTAKTHTDRPAADLAKIPAAGNTAVECAAG